MSFFEFEDVKLCYEEVGEGIPFLLIHGWAIDHHFLKNAMEPVFAKVNYGFRRIYVDLPGMGESSHGSVRNGDDIVRVLMAFMDGLIGDAPFMVGGNSFGSEISRAICARYPERILALMLIVPSDGIESKRPDNGIYRIDEAFMESLPEGMRDAFSRMNANLTKEAYERYVKLAWPSVCHELNNDYLHHVLKGKFGFNINKAFEKKRYDSDVLILVGDHDTAVGYENQKNWLSLWRRGEYKVIRGAGHNINIDCPEEFEETVSEWLIKSASHCCTAGKP